MDLYTVRNLLNSGKSIHDIKLRVTSYSRVSTDKYEQANSLKNQVEHFTEMIKNNPNWIYIDGYVDEGISGTSINKRNAFLQMIQDAKRGKFDFIITKEISRFSRNTLDSIQYTQELLSYGVGVLFQSDNINTLYPDAELRLTIMSSIAQEEVRKLSERVKFGFQRSINQGRVLGNNAIWGYKKENGKLVIVEEEAELIKQIFEMYTINKYGLRTISNMLFEKGHKTANGNPLSFSTVRNIIANPKYKGYYCGNKTRVIDYRLKQRINIDENEWITYKDHENVPAIVSEDMWEQANRLLRGRGEKAKLNESAYQSRYTYSGKIFCDEHNTTFHRAVYRYKNGEKEVWQCKIYREKGKEGCASPTLYTTELDIIVKEAFNEFILKKSDIIHRMIERYNIALSDSTIDADIVKKRSAITKVVSKKDKLLELNIDGKISNDEFAERNDVFNKEISEINEAIVKLRHEQDEILRTKDSIKALNKIIEQKIAITDEVKENEIVNTALEKIVVIKTDDKNKVLLKIFFRLAESQDVEIDRNVKGKLSYHFVPSYTYDPRQYTDRGIPHCRYREAIRGIGKISAARIRRGS